MKFPVMFTCKAMTGALVRCRTTKRWLLDRALHRQAWNEPCADGSAHFRTQEETT